MNRILNFVNEVIWLFLVVRILGMVELIKRVVVYLVDYDIEKSKRGS